MVWRHAANFFSSALDLWLYSTSSDAAITHNCESQFEVGTFDEPQGEGVHSRGRRDKHT